MKADEKNALVELTLTRTAEQLGDITESVMALYYRRHPEAKDAFDKHGRGNRPLLEGEMVERALYYLMYWFESPGEIEISLSGSVVHHNDTLEIPPQWYGDLIKATADAIIDTIPAENSLELAAWKELCRDLDEIVEASKELVSAPISHTKRQDGSSDQA